MAAHGQEHGVSHGLLGGVGEDAAGGHDVGEREWW